MKNTFFNSQRNCNAISYIEKTSFFISFLSKAYFKAFVTSPNRKTESLNSQFLNCPCQSAKL